ncbi:uncharacterized protein LOC141845928 [Curcuma longa]|uniref:uncharacterized protein LOC141845928 n=1 Tax=Curcuma longa TaxID=136217 RepID=UPI003D9DF1C3
MHDRPLSRARRHRHSHSAGHRTACNSLFRARRGETERFVKRRERLLGPNLSTLKAIEILTDCYILVQGNTVAAMGSFKGLKQVRRIVEDCIHNQMHPVYHIKILQKHTLLMKRELAKNPALANENWDRFLPKFKKKNVQRKVKAKAKKPYTPFPPPQPLSKLDLELESGEYFLSVKKKSAKKWQEKKEKEAKKVAENKRKREAAFVPPKEPSQIFDSKKSDKDKNDLVAVTKSLKAFERLLSSLGIQAMCKLSTTRKS